MSIHDHTLIESIEAGDAARLRGALKAGASPSARKSVTMVWNLYRDREDRHGETVGIGTPEIKEETIQCESALALAIAYGRADLVELLLAAGANPDEPVEWKVCAFGEVFTQESWESYRHLTWSFPSALVLAVGRRGRVKWTRGSNRTDWQFEADSGKIRLNLPGGEVRVHEPRTEADSCVARVLAPSLEVVSVLLRYGARITEAAVAGSGGLDDPRFPRLLQHHQEKQILAVLEQHDAAMAAMPERKPAIPLHSVPEAAATAATVSATGPKAEPKPTPPPDTERWLAVLESRLVTLERTVSTLSTDAADRKAGEAALLEQYATLEAGQHDRAFEASALKALVAELSREVAGMRRSASAVAGGAPPSETRRA